MVSCIGSTDGIVLSLHGTVATKRMCDRKFLHQVLWHSFAKLCTNNYENPSIFVEVTAKKSVAPFSCGHGVHYNFTSVFNDCTRLYLRFHGLTFHLQCLGCGASTGPLMSSKVCLSGNHLVAPLHIQHGRLVLVKLQCIVNPRLNCCTGNAWPGCPQ